MITVTGATCATTVPAVPASWRDMPTLLQARLASEAVAIVADWALVDRLRGIELVVRPGGTPTGFATLLGVQREHWSVLVREFSATQPD